MVHNRLLTMFFMVGISSLYGFQVSNLSNRLLAHKKFFVGRYIEPNRKTLIKNILQDGAIVTAVGMAGGLGITGVIISVKRFLFSEDDQKAISSENCEIETNSRMKLNENFSQQQSKQEELKIEKLSPVIHENQGETKLMKESNTMEQHANTFSLMTVDDYLKKNTKELVTLACNPYVIIQESRPQMIHLKQIITIGVLGKFQNNDDLKAVISFAENIHQKSNAIVIVKDWLNIEYARFEQNKGNKYA